MHHGRPPMPGSAAAQYLRLAQPSSSSSSSSQLISSSRFVQPVPSMMQHYQNQGTITQHQLISIFTVLLIQRSRLLFDASVLMRTSSNPSSSSSSTLSDKHIAQLYDSLKLASGAEEKDCCVSPHLKASLFPHQRLVCQEVIMQYERPPCFRSMHRHSFFEL
jgi:hypothetical protein